MAFLDSVEDAPSHRAGEIMQQVQSKRDNKEEERDNEGCVELHDWPMDVLAPTFQTQANGSRPIRPLSTQEIPAPEEGS